MPRSLALRLTCVVGVGLVTTLGTLGTQAFATDTTLRVLATAVTAALCLEAAATNRGRLRLAWALIGSYMVLYAAGDVLWMWGAMDVANAIYMAAFAPGTAGLLLYPTVRTERRMWRSMVLDAVVLAAAVVYLTHTLALRAVWESGVGGWDAFTLTSYPIGSGLAFSLALLVLLRSSGHARHDMVLIGTAFAFLYAADTSYALMYVRGHDTKGTFVAVAYCVAPLVIGAAAAVATTMPTPYRTLRRHLTGALTPVLPDLAALLAIGAGLLLAPRDPASVILGVVVIAAVGVRQVAQTGDGWRLRGQLERGIEQRTRQLEEVTQAYQRLDAIKLEFVTAVSHELRTPLAAIRGALEMLYDGDAGELPDSATPILGVASRGSERLSRLVNDIIDLERLESGAFGFAPQAHPLGHLVSEACDALHPLAREHEVEIHVETLEAHVWCDSDRVVQVLINLLANALKFSPAGGRIRVVMDEHHDDHVMVSVVDQGRGIPADELDAVFERFHQVDMDDSRQKGGTGLGLTICRRIVERHGGRIWAESVEQGATFRFTLPTASEGGGPPAGPPTPEWEPTPEPAKASVQARAWRPTLRGPGRVRSASS